jgi:hypothetical protein
VEWRYSSTIFDLTLDGNEWSVTGPDRFTPGDRVPSSHWIRTCVGPDVRPEAMDNKIISPCRESNPGFPVSSKLHYRMSYLGFLALSVKISLIIEEFRLVGYNAVKL